MKKKTKRLQWYYTHQYRPHCCPVEKKIEQNSRKSTKMPETARKLKALPLTRVTCCKSLNKNQCQLFPHFFMYQICFIFISASHLQFCYKSTFTKSTYLTWYYSIFEHLMLHIIGKMSVKKIVKERFISFARRFWEIPKLSKLTSSSHCMVVGDIMLPIP